MPKTVRKKELLKVAGHSFKQNRNIKDAKKVGKGIGQLRSNSTIRRLQMYRTKVKRDKDGNLISGYVTPKSQQIARGEPARVEPSRNWFQNTRVIGQKELEKFRQALSTSFNDPYTVLLRSSKVPTSLLEIDEKVAERKHLIKRSVDFKEAFGAKSKRKRVKINASTLEELANDGMEQAMGYDETEDKQAIEYQRAQQGWGRDSAREMVFTKGTSKRIWGELYKVIDSSDVIIQVLDARDPIGCRCRHVEKFLNMEKRHKHLIFVLNKCDLVPTWSVVRWVKVLSREYPTIAFHASINNPFGKGSLIQVLRQFAQLHKEKKSISVGFVGYPNVGKSSIINTLRKKKVCAVAPIPGETKVWQFVTLMKRINLIDCPGITYPDEDTDAELVLRGVVRAEKVNQPRDYAAGIIHRVKPEYLKNHYKVTHWSDHVDFLIQLAKKTGKLLKGGHPDIDIVARTMIYDWQRGKIPWFVAPPFDDEKDKLEAKQEDVKKEEEDEEESYQEIHPIGRDSDASLLEVKDEEVDEEEEADEEEADEDADEDEEEKPSKPNATPFDVSEQTFDTLKEVGKFQFDRKDRTGAGYVPGSKEELLLKKRDFERMEKEKQPKRIVNFDDMMEDMMSDQDEDDEEEELQEEEDEEEKKLTPENVDTAPRVRQRAPEVYVPSTLRNLRAKKKKRSE